MFKINENHNRLIYDLDVIDQTLEELSKKKQTKSITENVAILKKTKQTLEKYGDALEAILYQTGFKTGEGLNNTNQLIDRLKLLGGSIMAGNNGVIPEFTQLSNYLNSVGVLSKNELQKLMKTIKMYLN